MKKNKIYSVLLLSSLWIIACNSHKLDKQVSELPENGGFSTEELQAKAAVDSDFRESKMYSSYMERASIEQSKKNYQMNDNVELLKEFELSLKNLKESALKLKKNPELTKNKQFIALVQLRAAKVREYQQILKNLPLNAVEKEHYMRLCRF